MAHEFADKHGYEVDADQELNANALANVASALFGVVFAAGWSPCIGPILGGIIGLASATASVAQGTALLLAYSAGLAVPFLAIAMGATWVARRLGWVGRHHRAVSIVSGAMLVVLGILMVTNTFARLAALTAPLGG